jgi:ElaB/YqjD/DUF883 family membrane-anchored ribosome-binding protein
MSNEDVQRGMPRSSTSSSERIAAAASAAISQASDAARDAGAKARDAASDAASNMSGQFKDLLDRQIGTGANIAGHFASSARQAADDIADQSPFAAGVVRSVADRVEGYAGEFKDRTVDELIQTASDFTRRQPAVVFGLAALAGFFIFRTVKSTPSIAAPPIQPSSPGDAPTYKRAG